MAWFDPLLFAYRGMKSGSVTLPTRGKLKFVGAAVSDNAAGDETVVTVTGTSNFVLDSGSAAIVAGDCFCAIPGSTSATQVTKATATALALVAGTISGVALAGASPGGSFAGALPGSVVTNDITGLGASTDSASHDIQVSAAARLVYLYKATGAENLAGQASADGVLTVNPKGGVVTAAARTFMLQTYGGVADGGNLYPTDNAAAWTAMMAAISADGSSSGAIIDVNGDFYSSHSFDRDKGVHIRGHAGGTGEGVSVLRTAPGVSVLRDLAALISPNGSGADYAHTEHVDLYSTPMTNYTQAWAVATGIYLTRLGSIAYAKGQCRRCGGSANGVGGTISALSNATPIAVSAVGHNLANNTIVRIHGALGNTAANGIYKVGGASANAYNLLNLDGTNTTGNGAYTGGAVLDVNPNVFFRWDGGGTSAAGSGVNDPAAFKTAVPGDVVTDGTGSWTCEAYCVPRPVNFAVGVGFRYYIAGASNVEDDNRRYFECITAGTTANTTAVPAGAAEAQQTVRFADGTAVFEVKTHSAVEEYCTSVHIRHVYPRGVGNACIFAEGVANTDGIDGASNTTPIVITAADNLVAANGAGMYGTGQQVYVYGVGGNTAANGLWVATVTGAKTFSLAHLDGSPSVGNGVYVPGTGDNFAFHLTSCDFADVSEVFAGADVGIGVYAGTSDANGMRVADVRTVGAGSLWGSINGQLGKSIVASAGGHNVHDRIQGFGRFSNNYAQNGTGRGVRNDGNRSKFDACGSENALPDEFGSGAIASAGHHGSGVVVGAGCTIHDGVGGQGRGVYLIDELTSRYLYMYMIPYDSQTFFRMTTSSEAGTGGNIYFRYQYVGTPMNFGTGWFGWMYGDYNPSALIGFSGVNSTEGQGHWSDFQGHFTGLSVENTVLWEGLYNRGLASKRIRGSHYLAGDRVKYPSKVTAGTWDTLLVATSGYRGDFPGGAGSNCAWRASHAYVAVNATTGVEADTVEPTTNTFPLTTASMYAFKASTGGTSGSTEPTWVNTPGSTTSDGSVVWTCLGTCPTYLREGYIDDLVVGYTAQTQLAWQDSADTDSATAAAKYYVLSYRTQVSISTSTSNQTLFTVPTLPDNSVCTIDVAVEGKRNGNHSSYIAAKMTAARGRNNAGTAEAGTDILAAPIPFGSENSLSAVTFDVSTGSNTPLVRVVNNPAYQVDYGLDVSVRVRIA